MLFLFCSWRKLIVGEVKWCFRGQQRAGSSVCCALLGSAPGTEPLCRGVYHLGAELALILTCTPNIWGLPVFSAKAR